MRPEVAFVVKLICTAKLRTVGDEVQMEKCLVGDTGVEVIVSRLLQVRPADVKRHVLA